MNRLLSSRLAALGGTAQADAVAKVDRAGAAADAAVAKLWAELLRIIGQRPFPQRAVAAILHRLPDASTRPVRSALADIALWAHRQAARRLVSTLPRAYLAAAARRKAAQAVRESRLLEADGYAPDAPGSLLFGMRAGRFFGADLMQPSTEPSLEWFMSLLFPPPAEDRVAAWLNQLIQTAPVPSPEGLASALALGIASGKSNREVAAELRPIFDGSRTRATRAARTYGLYVSNAVQHETHEQLGDMVVGYQVHSVGGENARHNHALRSGRIYYRNPAPGQPSFAQMPSAPLDRDDPPYTEAGLAHNCRCWMSPVLEPLERIQSAPQFTDPQQSAAIIEPATYVDWWNQAEPRRQRIAVGARRYATATQALGRPPQWEELIDTDGRLLSPSALRDETLYDRTIRVQKVRQVVAANRKRLVEVARFGFEVASV